MNKYRFWSTAILLLAVLLLWHFHWRFSLMSSDLVMGDTVDQALLVRGLERAHGWRDVSSWWSGSWVGGDAVKFYRPLTSTIWWLEFRLWGERNGAAGFMAVHCLSHFAVCLLLVGWARQLVGHKVALLCGALWASCALDWLTLPTPAEALHYWKDDPDLWVGATVVGGLWALLRFLRDGKRGWLAALFGCQIVGIAFKEMAYVLPFLAAALLWHERQWKRWPLVAALLGVVLAAYIFRFWALDGPGFRFGTNGSWFSRWLMNTVGGRPLSLMFYGEVAAPSVAALLWAWWLARRSRSRQAVAFAILGAVGVVWSDAKAGIAGETLTRLATPLFSLNPASGFQLSIDVAVVLLLFALSARLWKTRNRAQIFAWLWVFAAYLPLMTAPLTAHALYLPSIGWALWLALAFADIWRTTDWHVLARRLTPRIEPLRAPR